MPVKIYWLHNFDKATKLGIMARPRGGDWLEDDIINLKSQNVSVVVSLLEPIEVNELDLRQQSELCLKHSILYINFPIPDRGIPKQDAQFQDFINRLKGEINSGRNTVVHCRMGIGRSSIIAGRLLLNTGRTANEIFAHISKIRGLRVPDTEEQIAWLKKQEQ